MTEVVFKYWHKDNGYSHSETYASIDEDDVTLTDVLQEYKDDIKMTFIDYCDGLNAELWRDGKKIDELFITKGEEA